MVKKFTVGLLAAILTMVGAITAVAGTTENFINGGWFSNWDTLTWTSNTGIVTTYGRGARFCDEHHEITDPEYFLKEEVLYPGEDENVLNRQGVIKSNYPEQSVNAVKEFLNSFDWIHSDELTRAEQVYRRIALGYHGNEYGFGDSNTKFTVLETGKGICGNYAREYTMLAKSVGLECVVYQPSSNHEACLLKLNGAWFALDPTSGTPIYSNNTTYPVDFETEYHRWEKEAAENWDKYRINNPDSWSVQIDEMNKQLAEGLITEKQYDEMYVNLIK